MSDLLTSLFDDSGANGPSVLSVSDLAGGVRDLLETEYGDVWVEGELSNVRRPASGHCYFTLKDAEAQMRGVLWRSAVARLFFEPRDGMLVRVRGGVSLYPPRGEVQLVARLMAMAGEGALQQAFEALKQQLAAEGLFDAAHKKPLPKYPEAIGVITSGTGAALHDIHSILERRFPQARLLVCPVRVQGAGAAEMVADAIEAFNALPAGDPLRPEVLIVGRGGGSLEDLWAFNEEVVARALFASGIPTISAVGHETDVSIADFVADVRAATPSMAAELAVPNRTEIDAYVRGLSGFLTDHLSRRLADHRQQIRYLTDSHAFHRPRQRLDLFHQRLDDATRRLHEAMPRRQERQQQHLATLHDRLRLLDPQRPLAQGYVRVERDGRSVRSQADLAVGDTVQLVFHDGERVAEVKGNA